MRLISVLANILCIEDCGYYFVRYRISSVFKAVNQSLPFIEFMQPFDAVFDAVKAFMLGSVLMPKAHMNVVPFFHREGNDKAAWNGIITKPTDGFFVAQIWQKLLSLKALCQHAIF